MADYAALQEQNKLSALRAMAEGNPDPYAGSSSVISGAQTEALNRYAGDAAGRNAPAGSVSQGEALIRAPSDNAVAGLGKSDAAYNAELAALQAEAQNAAANPASIPQFGTGSSSSSKKGQGYNQYGGYGTAAEYENAVQGRAVQAEQERGAQVQGEQTAAQAPVIASGSQDLAGALARQQASNEAIVGGPGAVIHGIGQAAPAPPPPPPRPVAAADAGPAFNDPFGYGNLNAGKPGYVPPAPTPTPRPPATRLVAPGGDTSNYTPEQVAMLRAAADQSRQQFMAPGTVGAWSMAGPDRPALSPAGQIGREYDPTLAAIQDPRNLYEFAERAAINNFGGDPYEAIGRFSPDWAMRTYALPGVTGPNQFQGAQNEALERANNEAAGLGSYTDAQLQSRRTQATRDTPDYATGAAVANRQLASLAGGPKSNQPVTLDGLRAALAEAGVDPLVAAQVIKDYGPSYPGASFYTQPEDQATAAASAGTTPTASAGNANG